MKAPSEPNGRGRNGRATWGWRSPRLEFSGTPLEEAITLMHLHAAAGNRLVITSPTLPHIRVSGLFRPDNTTAFIDWLETGFGIGSKRRTETEIGLYTGP